MIESPSVQVFKRWVNMALKDMAEQWTWLSISLTVGLDDLKGLFQLKWFCDLTPT